MFCASSSSSLESSEGTRKALGLPFLRDRLGGHNDSSRLLRHHLLPLAFALLSSDESSLSGSPGIFCPRRHAPPAGCGFLPASSAFSALALVIFIVCLFAAPARQSLSDRRLERSQANHFYRCGALAFSPVSRVSF